MGRTFETMILSKEDQTISIDMWFKLADESCTIENMNAAEGSSISINLYAKVVE